MSFLFDGETVSKVWYQITQETTTHTRVDFWGLLEGQYYIRAQKWMPSRCAAGFHWNYRTASRQNLLRNLL